MCASKPKVPVQKKISEADLRLKLEADFPILQSTKWGIYSSSGNKPESEVSFVMKELH